MISMRPIVGVIVLSIFLCVTSGSAIAQTVREITLPSNIVAADMPDGSVYIGNNPDVAPAHAVSLSSRPTEPAVRWNTGRLDKAEIVFSVAPDYAPSRRGADQPGQPKQPQTTPEKKEPPTPSVVEPVDIEMLWSMPSSHMRNRVAVTASIVSVSERSSYYSVSVAKPGFFQLPMNPFSFSVRASKGDDRFVEALVRAKGKTALLEGTVVHEDGGLEVYYLDLERISPPTP